MVIGDLRSDGLDEMTCFVDQIICQIQAKL